MDRMFQGLYKHLKDIKQRVVGKHKIQKRSVESFLEHYQNNDKKLLPIVEEFNFTPDNFKPVSSISNFSFVLSVALRLININSHRRSQSTQF